MSEVVKPILKMGNPQLQQVSQPVNDMHDPHLEEVIKDLQCAMAHYGGVGIAAPQIGISLRIIMFGFEKNARYPQAKPVPFTILFNPSFEPQSDAEEEDWEGCLSVPGLRGLVPRYQTICYQGYSPQTQTTIKRTVSGFHARIIQHECDHLDGILFPERIRNRKQFGFEGELQY